MFYFVFYNIPFHKDIWQIYGITCVAYEVSRWRDEEVKWGFNKEVADKEQKKIYCYRIKLLCKVLSLTYLFTLPPHPRNTSRHILIQRFHNQTKHISDSIDAHHHNTIYVIFNTHPDSSSTYLNPTTNTFTQSPIILRYKWIYIV